MCRQGEAGFFLLEAILLGCLLAAASEVLLIGMAAETMRMQSETSVTAVFLAQEQLARTAALPRERLAAAAEFDWLGGESGSPNPGGQQFRIVSRVTIPERLPALREITVRVTWEEKGKKQEIELRRLVRLRDG